MLGEHLETPFQDIWMLRFQGHLKAIRKIPQLIKKQKANTALDVARRCNQQHVGNFCHQTHSVHYARVPQSGLASANWLCCPSPRPPLLNPAPHLSATLCLYSLQHCKKPNQGVPVRQQLKLQQKTSPPFPKPVWYLPAEG